MPLVLGCIESVPELAPLAGVTESHVWLSDAVQFSMPPPVLLTVAVCAAGLEPLVVAVNERPEVETVKTGGGAATVKVTAIVFGDPVASGAVTVMTPL